MVSFPALSEEEKNRLLRHPAYENHLLLEEGAWLLYLSDNQAHLGRATAWFRSRHVDLHPYEDLTINESLELRLLIRRYRKVLSEVVGVAPALLNCEWLGNLIDFHRGHGHMHLIPRYEVVPTFAGKTYPDDRFGMRSDYQDLRMDPTDFFSFRDQLRQGFV